MNGDWNVSIQYEPGRYDASLTIWARVGDKIQVVGADDTITTYERGAAIPPTLKLDPDMLRALADALAAKGIKPKDAGYDAGRLIEMEKHREDLRTLLKLGGSVE